MAYAQISKPGTKFGPCAESCHHKDCADLRATAETVCKLCGRTIGYDSYFCTDGGAPVHYVCALKNAEGKS